MSALIPKARRNQGRRVVLALLLVLIAYWLSGELIRWHGKTAVELTVLDTTGKPIGDAELHLRQSGRRWVIVIPFVSHGRLVEKDFIARTEGMGFCRFTFGDANCRLMDVKVAGRSLPILGFTDFYRGVPDQQDTRSHDWPGLRGGEVNVSHVTVSTP